eukprot:365205-Chlamydomonas_euryale.AAC.15
MFATPSEFHNDVKHSFKNVYQYNPAHDSFCMVRADAPWAPSPVLPSKGPWIAPRLPASNAPCVQSCAAA